MINFKATKTNLLAHAASLEDYANKSLTSWILCGMDGQYQRVIRAASSCRIAANFARIADRREFLQDVDASF